MFYICAREFTGSGFSYGVRDTDDGVVEYFSPEQLREYIAKGYIILGVSPLGFFTLTEKQTKSFDMFMQLINLFNQEGNKNGTFKLENSPIFDDKFTHRVIFRIDSGGYSLSHTFMHRKEGYISYRKEGYDGSIAARQPNYYGWVSPYLILYSDVKPDLTKSYPDAKYYTNSKHFFSDVLKP